jgi:putative ABC transport system ATP-binding protein
MIKLEKVNKTYHNGAPLHVLKGIDLEIKKGEMVSIMGASGSGKSTLLNLIGILDTYDTGNYYLNNQLIRNLNESKAAELRNKLIGFVFQGFNLLMKRTIADNVSLPLIYAGKETPERRARAEEILNIV